MANPTTRQELKDYCLRKLGSPVSEINITDEQLEDRIDDAIQFMVDYNFNLQEQKYISVQITQQILTDGFITLSTDVLAVSRILPIRSGGSQYGSFLFDIQYHLTANDLINTVGSGDVSAYYITKQHIATIQDLFNVKSQHEFRRFTGKLYFKFDASQRLSVNDFIVLECYVPIDTTSKFYGDKFLREYAELLMARQWGQNLLKFQNTELPGGIKLNGTQIYENAQKRIEKMEEDAIFKYSEPLSFFLG